MAITQCCIAQNPLERLSLTVECDKPGDTCNIAGENSKFTAQINNKSNDTIPIITMACSYFDNFIFDLNTKSMLKLWGCDANFPLTTIIYPHSSKNFYFLLNSNRSKIANYSTKLGFIECKKQDQLGAESWIDSSNVVWSDSFHVKIKSKQPKHGTKKSK